MPRRRGQLQIEVQIEGTTDTVDADAVAEAFVSDLQTDDVVRWADQVRSAIVASRRPVGIESAPKSRGKDQTRRRILSAIADLQHELKVLDAA